jgi:hypothetical protein
MNAKQPRYWTGSAPTQCDIDKRPITTEFVDGKTTVGPWANMCPQCFQRYGVGIGTGRGQRYVKQEDGRFMKTEG